MIHKIYIPTSQRIQFIFTTQIDQLMLFKEIIRGDCIEGHNYQSQPSI